MKAVFYIGKKKKAGTSWSASLNRGWAMATSPNTNSALVTALPRPRALEAARTHEKNTEPLRRILVMT